MVNPLSSENIKITDNIAKDERDEDIQNFRNNVYDYNISESKEDKNKCIDNCDNDNIYKYEYNNKCFNACPNGTYLLVRDEEYFCFNNTPKGYYLDLEKEEYKECFNTCKECYGEGNEITNNCIECIPNFTLYNNNMNISNCYEKCDNYYYFDENNIFHCTETCPEKYNKLIEEQNRCISNCENDNIYKYEYDNKCYISSPNGTFVNQSTNDNIIVEDSDNANNTICCLNDNQNLIREKIESIINEIKSIYANKLNNNTEEKSDKNQIAEYYKKIADNIENIFMSDKYDKSHLVKGYDEIFKIDKMIVALTTQNNQRNNLYNNMSSIDLGKCEKLLKNYYNISYNDTLYMIKIDFIQDGLNITKVEFNIYHKLSGNKLEKLNKSICENNLIYLSVPIVIAEELDKLNTSSGYFNDICYTSTSDCGTDITMKDRQKKLINSNKIVCQENCDFSEYNHTSHRANCSCKVKESSIFDYMNINKTKLFENFANFENISNINILKCYDNLFDIIGIINNIGFYVISLIIIYHIISFFVFHLRQSDTIKETINNIYKEKKADLNTIKFSKNQKGSDRKKIDNIIETNNNNDKSIENSQKIRAKKRKKKKYKKSNNNIKINENKVENIKFF